MKTDYNKLFLECAKNSAGKLKLLLHACCAPCATHCLKKTDGDFITDLYFYNPNITLESEFIKRLNELKKYVLLNHKGVSVIETSHLSSDFYSVVAGLENEPERGKRCYICYKLRLEKTAQTARELNYDYFATTLTISPHKNAEWINEIGFELEKKYGVKYLPSDFKKENGYLNSIKLSKENGLYRQNYCGCEYSKK